MKRKLAPPSVDFPPCEGEEEDAHWVFSKVDKYGKRAKRKRLRPGDHVIGYEFIRQGPRRKYRVKVRYESSPLPRPWLWVVNHADGHDDNPRLGSCTRPGFLPCNHHTIVGHALKTADGWDDKFHIYECTKVKPCCICLHYHRREDVELVTGVEYRGYLWQFGRVFLPKCRVRENVPTWVDSGGYMCVECHKKVRTLACSIIDLDLTIAFIKQECLDVTNGRTSVVGLRNANRRRISQGYGGANATFVGNVSRLARETFDRG